MAKPKIYIDGQEGTTGLRIFERFAGRDDIEILTIDPALRKDTDERKKLINASDITFLCLPDAAAKEAVSLVENENVRIIDASTAHRVNPDWAYGFPELSAAHREAIVSGKRIANPGCHATGFVSLVCPLVASGVLAADQSLLLPLFQDQIDLLQLSLGAQEGLKQGQDLIVCGAPRGEVGILLHVGDGQPLLLGQIAAVVFFFSRKNAEQGGFPRAVDTDDANAIALVHLERDVVE